MLVPTRWSCLVASLLLACPVSADAGLEDTIPADALAWVSVDVGRAVRDYGALDLVHLFHDEEVQDFLEPAIEALTSAREWRELQAALFLAESYGVPQVFAGDVSIAILGLGGVTGQGIEWHGSGTPLPQGFMRNSAYGAVLPDFLLSVETTGREAFEVSLGRALEIDPEWVTEPVDLGGVAFKVTRIQIDSFELALYHGFAGPRFVAGLRPERVRGALAGLAGTSIVSNSLAADSTFRRFRQVSTRDSHLLEAFVNVRAVLNYVGPAEFSERDRQEIAATGLDGVQGAGFVLGMESGRLRDSLSIVFEEERRGVLKLLDGFSGAPLDAAAIGSGAVGGLAWRWDLATLLDRTEGFMAEVDPRGLNELRQGLAQASEELGVDVRSELIGGLGDGGRLGVQLPRGGFIPDVIGSLGLGEGSTIQATIDRLLPLVVEEARGAFEVADVTVRGADRAFYAKIPGAPVSPAFAFTPDGFHFAASVATLKRSLGSAGKREAKVSEDMERCLATTVGSDLSHTSFMFYVDLASASAYGLGMAGMFLPALLKELPVELDAAMFPMPETVADYLSGLLLTARVGEDYVSVDSSSSVGGLVLPMVAGAAAVVAQQRAFAMVMEAAEAETALRRAEALSVSPEDVFVGVNYDPNAGGSGGLSVISVVPGSPASAAGIEAGDRIIDLGGASIGSAGDFNRTMATRSVGDVIPVTVQRGGETKTFSVILGRRGDYVKG